ncbi:MAG: protein kinase [Deltaproteobacteria bacterium]|nr:protein kinase [Deltaproteobacteria bacterium]
MELCLGCGRVFGDGTAKCPSDGDELLPYESSRPEGDVVEGGYRVVRIVGVGQCGEVFECREVSTDRQVVLRLMAPELTGSRIPTELLLRHMMQLREFHHANAVQVHDVRLHEGRLALVRDWVDGERLLDVLLRERVLTIPHSIDLAIQIAEALAAAHKVDLLHLQLRPSNVFLEVGKGSALEQARLVDFGIGPQRNVDGRDVFGTIRTLAPEQIEGWDPSPRSDIYSLGLLVHRLVTGRQPFAGTGDDVVRQALEEALPPMTSPAGRPVPPTLDALVHEMAEKRASERPRGMVEVLERLRRIQAEVEDDLPFELAFREEQRRSSTPGAHREQATVVMRRSSIAPPPPVPSERGRVSSAPVPPLFTPRGAEKKRRESLAPAAPADPAPEAPEGPRREAQTMMWPALSETVTKLSSPQARAVSAAKATAATPAKAQPTPVAPRKPQGAPKPAAAAGHRPQRTLVGQPSVVVQKRPAIAPAPAPEAVSPEEPVTLEGIPIADSIPTGIPVDVVERAEQAGPEPFPTPSKAPERPISIEPPPLMAFGLEPGAIQPEARLAPRIAAPRRRTALWLAVGGIGVAAAATVAVWLVFFRGSGTGSTEGHGAAGSAPDAPAMRVSAAAPVDAGTAAAAGAPPGTPADPARVSDAEADGALAAPGIDPPVVDGGATTDAPPDGMPGTGPVDAAPVEAATGDAAADATLVRTPDAPADPDDVPTGASAEELKRIAVHWVQQGNTELRGRQFAQARASFERALRFDPRSREARIGLGRIAFQQGQFAEAVRYLEPMFRGRGNMELGIAYVRVGRPGDAKAQFQKILERDPGNADAQRALGSLP